jgi:hypothetical protein
VYIIYKCSRGPRVRDPWFNALQLTLSFHLPYLKNMLENIFDVTVVLSCLKKDKYSLAKGRAFAGVRMCVKNRWM